MHKAKFFQILRTLNKDEFKKFGKFLRSPIFNTNKTIIKLCDTIKPCYPEFINSKLEKEKIFKRLFPNEGFKEKKIRNISSEMLKLSEKYLLYLNTSLNNPVGQIAVLKEIINRDLVNFIDNYYSNFSKIQNNNFEKDEYYYLNSYTKLSLINSYYRSKMPNRKTGDSQNEINNLIYFICIASLKLYVYTLDESKINSIDYNYYFLPDIKILCKKSIDPKSVNTILEMLIIAVEMRLNPSDILFEKLKRIKNEHRNSLTKEYLKILYNTLYNYVIDKEAINKKYTRELYEISKEVLQTELIFENGNIPDSFFGNYVSTCLQLKYFKKAEKFIANYGQKLSKKIQDDVINLNLIRLAFYQKKYSQCLFIIEKFNSKHWYYFCLRKNYQLMCCFELKYFDQMKYIIDSYKHFLKNSYIPDDYRKIFLKFLSVFNKLLKLSIKPDNILFMQLLKEIRSGERFTNEAWIKEKIKNIENRKGQLKN